MKNINELEFKNEVLEKEGLVIVDFWAEWCNPCKMLTPVLEKLNEEFKEIEFFKIDVDQNGALVDSYSIGSIPTLLLFKNGEVINRVVGFKPEVVIKDEILKNI